MKSKFLTLLSLLYTSIVSAQLVIPEHAEFVIMGNMQLTLQNTSLLNNGTFVAGKSRVSFTGDDAASVSGRQPVQFNELEIKKTNNASVILRKNIAVQQRVLFISGFFNLNGFNADLGTSGHLDGEQENTRIIGPKGGEVIFTTSLNSPTGANPANLGVFITSNQNLGNVTIKRGHKSQVTSPGTGNSILRYYDILPANNTHLNATLRFKYFDGELNGPDENLLVVLKSQNTTNWANLGFTSRNVVANFVEQTGIGSFRRFTLSGIAGYGLDSKMQYSTALQPSYDATDEFKLWPNPVHDMAFINIVTQNKSQVIIKLFDSKGAVVKIQRATLLRGSNQLSVDMKLLANGVYQLSVDWNNGQMQKTMPVLKY